MLKLNYISLIIDTYVLPILNYGCETWVFIKSPDIEKIHLLYCKQLLGINRKTTTYICVQNELGCLKLYSVIKEYSNC